MTAQVDDDAPELVSSTQPVVIGDDEPELVRGHDEDGTDPEFVRPRVISAGRGR